MFSAIDNTRDSGSIRKTFLESLLNECQQPTQPYLSQLIEYYFLTESQNAFLLIKEFHERGKEQTKILIEHLNTQGLKQCNRYSSSNMNSEAYLHEEQEKVAHLMKVFRILCLIIHSQVVGLAPLIKENTVLPNCLAAITKYKEDPNILAQACYFFASLTATLPGEIVQHTEAILNIFKATCKYLFKHIAVLRQLSIQTNTHSLENVQLWIVNQSAHALFYTLYTVYPCNFLYFIQREIQRNENLDVFEQILLPMFQRIRLNPRLIDSDRKRELDRAKRPRQPASTIIYEARKLSLDPLFGRELPASYNWMHQEMKRILPFAHFKRQSPTRSLDHLADGFRSVKDMTSSPDNIPKRSNSSPFQKFKDKVKSFIRSPPASSTSTTFSVADTATVATATAAAAANTRTSNTLSIPDVSTSVLSSPAAPSSDMRVVKTMPELQSSNDLSASNQNIPQSELEYETFVKSVIDVISVIHNQSLPSHWRKILGRYDPNLLAVVTPERQATFYVSPSEQSLDGQKQQQQLQSELQQIDANSPTSTNEKRQRCASASCASSQQSHSPVLVTPTTSTDGILPRTQSLSAKQRTRNPVISSTEPFHQSHPSNQIQYDDDANDDDVLIEPKSIVDNWPKHIPKELYICSEIKTSIIDELAWNDHDFISVPHFDFNDIVTNNCSSNELKQFDRLYKCHLIYEVFLTQQYKCIWDHLWKKQKTYQKHFYELQTTCAMMNTLQLEVNDHLDEELNIYETKSQCISDENSLLGAKVVELGKMASRRTTAALNDETNHEMQELEKSYEQLRKIVNNETLKLQNLRNELDDYEKELKLIGERSEQVNLIKQNVAHLNELNEQLECQYLRFTDDMSMAMYNQSLPPHLVKDDDDELHQMKSTSSTTTNGHDEASDFDSTSLTDEHRQEIDDMQQQQVDGQLENYDQLLLSIIEMLKNQNRSNGLTEDEINDRAYSILLEYMESKINMQNYLIDHNALYIDLYLGAQVDYIEQVEKELSLNKSILEQMQSVAM